MPHERMSVLSEFVSSMGAYSDARGLRSALRGCKSLARSRCGLACTSYVPKCIGVQLRVQRHVDLVF